MKKKASLKTEILELEENIRTSKARLAELRRKSAPESIADYYFVDSENRTVLLSELFAGKDLLIVIHNMGVRCSHCTAWADGFNGILRHIENKASFVLESSDTPITQRKFALDRSWNFKMVSSSKNKFKKDMGYGTNTNPDPGISVFRKDTRGKMERVSHAGFGPGDSFCVLWDLFDLLPEKWTTDGLDYFYSKIR